MPAGSSSSPAIWVVTGTTVIPRGRTAVPAASSPPPLSALSGSSFLEAGEAAAEEFAEVSRTLNVFRTPPFRATSTFTTSPGCRKPTTCWSCAVYSTGWPSTATMISPSSTPAPLAGELSLENSWTLTPRMSGSPTYLASVIGINAAIASETGYSQGYGFAVPIDLARQVMEQLISHGKVERAALGVLVQDADATDAKYVGLPDIRGVKVQEFSSESSPAKGAGVELGDIIVAVDGQPVEYTAH